MEFNSEHFASMMEQFLKANTYHTTLFGRTIDMLEDQSVQDYSKWWAKVTFDCVQWHKEQIKAFEDAGTEATGA